MNGLFSSYSFLDLADPSTLSIALALSGSEIKGSEITVEKAESKVNQDKAPQGDGAGGKRKYGSSGVRRGDYDER